MSELKSPGKPFEISKAEVLQAWEKVKAKKGAPGVDGCSIEDFEADLKNNLYKIWNRMSSGTLFPAAGAGGGNTEVAWWGHQNVGGADRGRPGRADGGGAADWSRGSSRSSIRTPTGIGRGGRRWTRWRCAGERCWQKRLGDRFGHPEVLRLALPRDLMVKAVEANTDQKWVVLYVKRWLKAPIQMPDGTVVERDRGTPQGSAVSPVLANLFLHVCHECEREVECR